MPISITGSVSNRFATGVVLAQPGFLVGGSASDQIYAKGLVPVGAINSYSGFLGELSDSWLVCDGKKIRPGNYPELYKVIGLTGGSSPLQRYYADLKLINSSSEAFIDEDSQNAGPGNGVASFYIKGGTRGFSEASGNRVTEQGDLVTITIYSNVTKSVVASHDARVWVIGGDYQISLALRKADQDGYTREEFIQELDNVKDNKDYSIRLYGRHRTDALSVWGTTLLPDFRNRTIYGAGAGTNENDNGAQMVVGDVINNQSYQIENGIVRPYGDGVDGLSGTTGASGSYVYTPGVVTNFIIRSKPEVNALIITGHNHDDRYVRIDMTAQAQLHTDSGLTAQKRANARYNIQAMSRETGDVHSGPAGITFQSEGQYKFRASSSSSNAANIEIENEYGWSKIKLGGASGSVIDIASPFDNTATGITSENYDIRFISDNSKAQIVAGGNLPLLINVGGLTGIERSWGISITGTTGLSAGSVGIKTSNPVMTLDVRGSGIKIGPSIYEGNTNTPAGNWNTRPLEGMFYGGMFNSTGLTTLGVSLTMGTSLFPENPNGIYTIDPGSGISILAGNTVTIQSGFTWKIL
jgi:surface antigen